MIDPMVDDVAEDAATSARREELGRERDAGRWQVPSACPPHWRGLPADRIRYEVFGPGGLDRD